MFLVLKTSFKNNGFYALNIDSSLFNNFKSLIREFCLFFKLIFTLISQK